MKKQLIMLTLLGVTLSAGASDMSTVPSAPEAVMQWFDIPVSNEVRALFNSYIQNKKAGSSRGGNSEFDLSGLNNALRDDFDSTGLSPVERFYPMIVAFCFEVARENSGAELESKRQYLLSGTLGNFVGKMCKDLGGDSEAVMALNVRTKVALRNDGYYKEYFLGDQADTEKRDGMRHYFFSEPVQRPSGLLAMLGFGYVDKRSWGRYLTRKGIGLAAVGGAAALGYGAKRYYDSRQMMSSEPGYEWNPVGIAQPTDQELGRVTKWQKFKHRWSNPAGTTEKKLNKGVWATGDNSNDLQRVKNYVEGNRRAWQESDAGYMTGEMAGSQRVARKGVLRATVPKVFTKRTKQHEAEDNFHQAKIEREQLKRERDRQLKEVRKAMKPQPQPQPEPKRGLWSRLTSRSTPAQIVVAPENPNPTGSAFDIEGGMAMGTTEYRENRKKEINQNFAAGLANVNIKYGTNLPVPSSK